MILQRQLEWRTRLHKWAELQNGKPFVWGETDCGTLAKSALLEMFGPALYPLVPEWTSPREALEVLSLTSPSRVLEELGAEKRTLLFMRAGDIVVSAEPGEEVGHEALMVCLDGALCITCSREDGVRQILIDQQAPSSVAYSLWEVSTSG